MSRLVDKVTFVSDTNTSGSQTCALTDLEYQSGDLLLAYVCHGWYNTNLSCSTSGWQQVGGTDFTENLLGYMQEGWFFKVAASSSETNPTFTANTSSGAWRVTICSVRGAHATTPISAWNSNGALVSGKPTAYTDTNFRIDAPVCAAPTGALLFYSVSSYNSSYSWGAMPYVPMQYGKFLDSWYVTTSNPQCGTLFYGANVATGGNSPSFYINMAKGGTSYVIAINDAATTEIEPYCKSGALLLRAYMGVSDNATWVAPQTATGNITIDGCTLASTFTAVIEQYRTTVFGSLFQHHKLNDSTMGTGSPVLVGRMDSYTFPDFSGRVIGIKYVNDVLPSTKVGTKGMSLVMVDSSGRVSLYNLRRFADLLYQTQMVCMIDHSVTPTDTGSGGAADWASIRYAGILVDRVTADTYGLVWACQELQVIDGWVLVGGSAGKPLSPLTIGSIYRSDVAIPKYSSQQGSGQLLSYAGFQIGNGSTPTYFKLTGGSIENAPASNTDVRIPAQTQTYSIKPSASCTMDFSSGIVRFNVRQTWAIDAAASGSCSHTFVGASFIGADVIWHADFACVSASFSGCYTVDGKTRLIDKAAFSACALTSGAYLLLNGGADIDHPSGAVNSTFVKGGETYAVELRTAGFYDFTDTTFSGYTNELYISAASGAVTIKLAVGQTQPDVYNPNGCTISWDVPTVDVTFGPLVAGTQVIVFADGTTTELLNVASSGTSAVWSGATGAYDYTIMKAGYLPVRGSGASPTASITIDPQQKIDRAYPIGGSSGLTIGTNCTANTGTLKFGLTTASTLQNFYSYMIEQWISNSALRNIDFPMVPNGPNSFRFIDWTWDGQTSINYLSRDGMQYYSAGATTDIWAAILSAGVPAGFQVRYQQEDGLGTTNALTTGNIDQLVKIYQAGVGGFDYRDWLVLKVQAAGHDQAEAVAQDIYGTLEDQLYVFGLTPIPNGIAAGATDATVTVTPEPTPVLWNGSYFSTTIKDTTDTHSGLQIMQAVRAENQFNWSDLVRPNGDKFKTVTGNFYGDAYLTPAGVRVVKADGVTPHPDFNLFNDDSGSNPYTPPVTAPITWAGALNGTTVLLYNDSNAGALIDTQSVSGAGGYVWSITLPHADVAVGDSLRLRFGHKEYYAGELQGTMTASGLAFVGSMTLHPIYAAWGLNGSTYDQANGGPFTMDGVNLEIDIGGGAGTGLKKALGAWTQHLMTLPAGLDAFYGAWDLLDLNQIRQNVAIVDVLIDKPSAGQYVFTDNEINYYRSDFSIPYNTTHSTIFMTYNAKPFVATVASSYAITGTAAEIIAAIPSAAMIANEVVNVAIVP